MIDAVIAVIVGSDRVLTPEVLFALTVAIGAGLMRGFAGVGSGMFMAPFFFQIFGPVQTVGIILLMEIIVTIQLLPSVKSYVQWQTIAPIGIAAVIVMPIGSWLLVSGDPKYLQFGVALLVCLLSLVLIMGWRYKGRKTRATSVFVGMVSGLMMALTSLGNPPVMIYLLSSDDTAQTNRANFTGYFAMTLTALILMMTLSGLMTWRVVGFAAVLLPAFMGAAWIGSRLFKKSNEALYRRVTLSILFLAGLYGMMA